MVYFFSGQTSPFEAIKLLGFSTLGVIFDSKLDVDCIWGERE